MCDMQRQYLISHPHLCEHFVHSSLNLNPNLFTLRLTAPPSTLMTVLSPCGLESLSLQQLETII